VKIIPNISFLLAVAILSWGSIRQIIKTKKRRSVDDIEIRDVIARIAACILFFFKFCFVGDAVMILGQGCLLFLFGYYLILVLIILLKLNKKDLS